MLFVDGATAAHAEVLEHRLPAIEAVFYLDDDAPPADTRPYEALAAAPAVADAGAGGDTMARCSTPGHDGQVQGRDAQPQQPRMERDEMIAGAHYDEETT